MLAVASDIHSAICAFKEQTTHHGFSQCLNALLWSPLAPTSSAGPINKLNFVFGVIDEITNKVTLSEAQLTTLGEALFALARKLNVTEQVLFWAVDTALPSACLLSIFSCIPYYKKQDQLLTTDSVGYFALGIALKRPGLVATFFKAIDKQDWLAVLQRPMSDSCDDLLAQELLYYSPDDFFSLYNQLNGAQQQSLLITINRGGEGVLHTALACEAFQRSVNAKTPNLLELEERCPLPQAFLQGAHQASGLNVFNLLSQSSKNSLLPAETGRKAARIQAVGGCQLETLKAIMAALPTAMQVRAIISDQAEMLCHSVHYLDNFNYLYALLSTKQQQDCLTNRQLMIEATASFAVFETICAGVPASECGAFLKQKDNRGQTLLQVCRSLSVFTTLLTHYADDELTNIAGETDEYGYTLSSRLANKPEMQAALQARLNTARENRLSIGKTHCRFFSQPVVAAAAVAAAGASVAAMLWSS